MKKAQFVVLLFAVMLLATACGGQSVEDAILEQALEQAGGGDIKDLDLNTDDGGFNLNVQGDDGEDIQISAGGDGDEFSITVEGEDGGTMSFGGGEVPEGMQVPIPDGGKVTTSFVSEGDKSVSLNYPNGSWEDLVSFYDSRLDPDSDDVDRYESSYSTEDGTFRNTSWSANDGNWNVTVSDCFGLTGDLNEVCVTVYESDDS